VHAGLGIGLTLVKHLVEAHGGAVTADSDGEGRGALFSVRLPLERLQLEGSPLVGLTDGWHVERDLQGVTVLVVEDEPDSRDMICTVLASHQARALPVSSALEGLSLLASGERIHAVVADIAMPGMDGYTFIERVRMGDTPGAADLVAVAVTAYAREEDRARALAAGYQAHLAKPIDPTRLAATINALVSRTG
jgi:CheY-like chemotaxis protein